VALSNYNSHTAMVPDAEICLLSRLRCSRSLPGTLPIYSSSNCAGIEPVELKSCLLWLRHIQRGFQLLEDTVNARNIALRIKSAAPHPLQHLSGVGHVDERLKECQKTQPIWSRLMVYCKQRLPAWEVPKLNISCMPWLQITV